MANSVDPDQTAPIGAVCSGSTLFASLLNSSVMLGNYLQQMTSADDIFRCIFFLGPLRVYMLNWIYIFCLFFFVKRYITIHCIFLDRSSLLLILFDKMQPRHEKTCLRGLRQSQAQPGLLSYRDLLE